MACYAGGAVTPACSSICCCSCPVLDIDLICHFFRRASSQASPFFDKVVFKAVKMRLGGRVRSIVSGGAPLAPHVEEFLKVTMCAPVVQVRRQWWRHWGT